MFGIVGVLAATSAVSQRRAEQLCALFQPAVAWIEKWLALFYVPSLVMLPLSLRTLSGEILCIPPHSSVHRLHESGRSFTWFFCRLQ